MAGAPRGFGSRGSLMRTPAFHAEAESRSCDHHLDVRCTCSEDNGPFGLTQEGCACSQDPGAVWNHDLAIDDVVRQEFENLQGKIMSQGLDGCKA